MDKNRDNQMEKAVPVEIVSITTSFSNRNGYNVLMRELGTHRRQIKMIVGVAEAQAIVVSLEKIITARPMTHQLVQSIIQDFGLSLKNVTIHKYENGVYFCDAALEDSFGNVKTIDCRPSDGICLALRLEKPIFVDERLFDAASERLTHMPSDEEAHDAPLDKLSLNQLNELLQKAIDFEDFELAAKIKDEIARR